MAPEVHSSLLSSFFLNYFYDFIYSYLKERNRDKESEHEQVEGPRVEEEADSMLRRKPGMGLNPRILKSLPEP